MRRTWPTRRRPASPARRPRGGIARVLDYALAFAVLGLLLLVAARLEKFSSIDAAGTARVADGDSLEFPGQRIRLRGIDAPELTQTCRRMDQEYACGRQSQSALRQLTEGREILCEGWERDRYGRLLATCTASGINLNERQVAEGWAVAYGGYEAEEKIARDARRGIWSGEFARPNEWRARHGDLSESPHDLFGRMGNWLRQFVGG